MPAAAVIPCLRYQDAPAAIDWLCGVFGFEAHLVVPGEAGAILHAELRIDTGNGIGIGIGMIMVGSSGRGFTCRDPDGHVWSVGTYTPAPVSA